MLELGFGTGELLVALAEQGRPAFGLDLAPAMHRVTARKLCRRGLASPRVRARSQAMPFPDASFDALLSTFPTPYVLAPETLHEVARLLRPGGRFVVTGLYYRAKSPLIEKGLRLVFGGSPDKLPAYFREVVERAGLTLAEIPRERTGCCWIPVLILEKR